MEKKCVRARGEGGRTAHIHEDKVANNFGEENQFNHTLVTVKSAGWQLEQITLVGREFIGLDFKINV